MVVPSTRPCPPRRPLKIGVRLKKKEVFFMSDFNFTKPVSPMSVQSEYYSAFYSKVLGGYRPKEDVVPFFADDVRFVLSHPSSVHGYPFSRYDLVDAAARSLAECSDKGVSVADGGVSLHRDYLFSDYDYHKDAVFGDASLYRDSAISERASVAKSFGQYLSDVCFDMSKADEDMVRYAGAFSYFVNPENPNPFIDGYSSDSEFSAEEFLDDALGHFALFRQQHPKESYAFMRFITYDEISLPVSLSALRDQMTEKADAYRAAIETKTVDTKRVPFNKRRGHALEDWSPEKGDNGFDYEEHEQYIDGGDDLSDDGPDF